MIRANLERTVITPPWTVLDSSLRAARPDRPHRRPSEGAADQFCAWAGRSGRRYIFSVFPLGADASLAAVPLAPKAIVLMVRRPATGPRRVLWAVRIETEDGLAAVARAIATQAAPEAHEIHLHVVSADAEVRRTAFADLAFPHLAEPLIGLLRLAG